MMINSLASVTCSSKRPEQNETVHCEQNRHKYRTWVLKAEILLVAVGRQTTLLPLTSKPEQTSFFSCSHLSEDCKITPEIMQECGEGYQVCTL